MAFGSSRTQQLTRTGSQGGGGIVVEGVEAIVSEFMREAESVQCRANDLAIKTAERAANIMRDLVPVDEGDVLDSITSDPAATRSGDGTYAEAGPDKAANKQAFVARYLEFGTSKMSPRPFVFPAADRVLPEFEQAVKNLSKL